MRKETGGPAFPVVTRGSSEDGDNQFGHQFSSSTWQFAGMTLRDYFAAKTLSAIISGSMADGSAFDADAFSVMPKVAYMMADSMLKARAE